MLLLLHSRICTLPEMLPTVRWMLLLPGFTGSK
jgi:hypothetical protein